MIARILLLFFFCSLQAKPLQVDVSAKSAILMNVDTGAILFEKQAHQPSFPASITKIATMLYVLEEAQDLSRPAKVSQECLKLRTFNHCYECPPYWLQTDGTMMGVKKGEELSYEALLHGMLLVSGNDAANTIAESMRGSIPLFMEDLNRFLQSIGCLKTHFCNPHGLHHPEHSTTAYDMCLIACRAMKNERFKEVSKVRHYLVPKTNKQAPRALHPNNPLIKPGKHFYPKVLWGKTGYTDAGISTLVAVAQDEGRTLACVLLGCERNARYAEAKKLFELAFRERKTRRVLFQGTERYTLTLEGAKAPLEALLSREIAIDYYPSEEPEAKAAIHWEALRLPIQKGQRVGEMLISDARGVRLAAAPLYAKEEVKATFWFALKEKWNRLIR